MKNFKPYKETKEQLHNQELRRHYPLGLVAALTSITEILWYLHLDRKGQEEEKKAVDKIEKAIEKYNFLLREKHFPLKKKKK